jgi:hypothetical protein
MSQLTPLHAVRRWRIIPGLIPRPDHSQVIVDNFEHSFYITLMRSCQRAMMRGAVAALNDAAVLEPWSRIDD